MGINSIYGRPIAPSVLFVQSPREEEARIAGSVQDIPYSDFIGHALGDMDWVIFPRVGASAGVLRRRPSGVDARYVSGATLG